MSSLLKELHELKSQIVFTDDSATERQIIYLKAMKFIISNQTQINEIVLSKMTKDDATKILTDKENYLSKIEHYFVSGLLKDHKEKYLHFYRLKRWYYMLYTKILFSNYAKKTNKPLSYWSNKLKMICDLNDIKDEKPIDESVKAGIEALMKEVNKKKNKNMKPVILDKEDKETEKAPVVEMKPKKKRGRPRKKKDEPKQTAPKRKRGRPRKNQTKEGV